MDLDLLFNNYGYLIIFIGTLIDHSGIPLFIVFAGVLQSRSNNFLIQAYLACLLSLELSDIISLYIGKYFRQKDKYSLNNRDYYKKYYSSSFTKIVSKILNVGAEFYNKSKGIICIFNKWFPTVGKYFPIFIGYKENFLFKQFLILIIGNIIYITFFYCIGYVFGLSIKEYSTLFTVISAVVFLIIYFLSINIFSKLKNKR